MMSTLNFVEKYGKDDPRLGDIIQEGEDGDVVIVGFPWDEGVRRNGGRIGAANGPSSFRSHLKKIGAVVNDEFGVDLRTIKISDSGDIAPSENVKTLEDAHAALSQLIERLVRQGKIPVVIGGGNDQSYANALGLLRTLDTKDIPAVVNIDAHLDVRPLVNSPNGPLAHSGSPFRLLLEDPLFNEKNGKFCEFASQGAVCSAEHWRYVRSHPRASIFPLSAIRELPNARVAFEKVMNAFQPANSIFVSFDIDSIASRDCPGVSAPASVGLSAEEAVEICRLAGRNPNVKLLDFSEYNPIVEDHRTGRLLVTMFYYFLLGVSERKASHSQH